jgi:hypothetical protein
MTADLPEWALEKARRIVGIGWGNQGQGIKATMQRDIATALVSVAKAERERAARIARTGGMFPVTREAIATAILADGCSNG